MNVIDQECELVFNRQVARETFLMGLTSRKIASAVKPGQFVMIRILQGVDPLLRRPFSVCGTEGEDVFLILYKVVGKGTTILSRIDQGERLSVLGPLGKGFDPPGPGERPVLVAGGMGIAPLVSLSRSLDPANQAFLTGYRSYHEVVASDKVGLADMEISVATEDGSLGYKGIVTQLLEDYLSSPGGGSVSLFACGPLPMLKKIATLSIRRDIPCQISLETSMGCGLGACLGCAVRATAKQDRTYQYVCQDGPVFRVQSLNWDTL